jgi:LuxR family maltose regulon positive regulatory protein
MTSDWRARLDAGDSYRLTLVLVLPGSDREAEVRQWLEGVERPAARIVLTTEDNAPAHFLTTLIEGLSALCPTVRRVDRDQPLDAGIIDVLNALLTLPDDVVLTMERYEVIEAQAVHTAVARMLDYLPPQVRLILVSREMPPLPNLPRLRARRQLWEVKVERVKGEKPCVPRTT